MPHTESVHESHLVLKVKVIVTASVFRWKDREVIHCVVSCCTLKVLNKRGERSWYYLEENRNLSHQAPAWAAWCSRLRIPKSKQRNGGRNMRDRAAKKRKKLIKRKIKMCEGQNWRCWKKTYSPSTVLQRVASKGVIRMYRIYWMDSWMWNVLNWQLSLLFMASW